MQAAFGSQALAYFVWAKAGPKRRSSMGAKRASAQWAVARRAKPGGLTPKWAIRILDVLKKRFGVKIDIGRLSLRRFRPATAFMGAVMREAITGSAWRPPKALHPRNCLAQDSTQ
jgi:hypothetical protein